MRWSPPGISNTPESTTFENTTKLYERQRRIYVSVLTERDGYAHPETSRPKAVVLHLVEAFSFLPRCGGPIRRS